MGKSDPASAVARVDVLVPAYNAEATVRDSIVSLQRQSLRDIRIVVIDDGSTDRTGAILDELAADDPRVVVLHIPNGGLVDGLNLGLGHCTADYVARLDADDIAAPDRLARQVTALDVDPACVALSCGARIIDADGQHDGRFVTVTSPALADPRAIPAREPYLLHPFLMARRAALVDVGGYRHCYLSEDTDLYWRLRERGTLTNIDEVLGDYRQHAQSVSSASIDNGRLMALHSQLAALSALRRTTGRDDLPFPLERIASLKGKPLAEMVALMTGELDAAEQAQLRPAVALKLVELSLYRPYSLDRGDWAFVAAAIRTPITDPLMRATMRESILQLALRMAAQQDWNGLRRFVPPSLAPTVAARLAFRIFLPDRLRRILRG